MEKADPTLMHTRLHVLSSAGMSLNHSRGASATCRYSSTLSVLSPSLCCSTVMCGTPSGTPVSKRTLQTDCCLQGMRMVKRCFDQKQSQMVRSRGQRHLAMRVRAMRTVTKTVTRTAQSMTLQHQMTRSCPIWPLKAWAGERRMRLSLSFPRPPLLLLVSFQD